MIAGGITAEYRSLARGMDALHVDATILVNTLVCMIIFLSFFFGIWSFDAGLPSVHPTEGALGVRKAVWGRRNGL